ncbi:MAG TPA: cobyric acid synthase [Rhizomicrobium sp.]|nr:cobyric acid synthase [Rhizomicrobium sp.]
MTARVLMFQGTGSDVGKSVLVAGLCRLFHNRGLRVAPFKPQNMSNNSAVTPDGGEIGRAQALQARACGIETSVHINPVLLKPEADHASQVILQGRVAGRLNAKDWRKRREMMLPVIAESFRHMIAAYDLLLVEGAGSPAETNLREGDVANMGFAETFGVPAVLIGDIDRGGVIASLVGTHQVLSPGDRARIRAFLVNKFRGDASLFVAGLRTVTEYTGWRALGIVPWLAAAVRLPAEDAVPLQTEMPRSRGDIHIAVPMLAHIANFDDLDPLKAEPGVTVTFLPPGKPVPLDADAIVLPGTKSTIADLAFLRTQGWDIDILAKARAGTRILGLCGGYQMLGQRISDPDGADGQSSIADGLGLLDVETTMAADKTVRRQQGYAQRYDARVDGYEIHMGTTSGPDCARPLLQLGGHGDGAVSADGRIEGTYLHGLFGSDGFRTQWIASLRGGARPALDFAAHVDGALDEIADSLRASLDIEALLSVAEAPGWSPPT